MRRRLATVRAAWAAMLLLAPASLLSATSPAPPTAAALTVLRILGARQLLQSAAALRWRSTAAAELGAATDGLHALTALAFGVADPRWRRAAGTDAAVAAAFAAAGWAVRSAGDG